VDGGKRTLDGEAGHYRQVKQSLIHKNASTVRSDETVLKCNVISPYSSKRPAGGFLGVKKPEKASTILCSKQVDESTERCATSEHFFQPLPPTTTRTPKGSLWHRLRRGNKAKGPGCPGPSSTVSWILIFFRGQQFGPSCATADNALGDTTPRLLLTQKSPSFLSSA
jgi:hypothetical protein